MATHTYTVNGAYRFPIDMLRYDESFPASEVDSYEIVDLNKKDKTIKLIHKGHPDWRPGRVRWSSFGWQVIDYKIS